MSPAGCQQPENKEHEKIFESNDYSSPIIFTKEKRAPILTPYQTISPQCSPCSTSRNSNNLDSFDIIASDKSIEAEPQLTLRCNSIFKKSCSMMESEWEPCDIGPRANTRWDKDLNIKRLKTDCFALDGLSVKGHQSSLYSR